MNGPEHRERLEALLQLVLEMADGNYAARIEPSDAADSLDAVAVGLNLMAESLELERAGRRRAEELLRDEVHAYEEAPAMFCSLEPENFKVVKCNETMARALGVDKGRLLRRRILNFLPVHERASAQRSLRAIAQGEPAESTTFHLRGEGGRPIPVLVSGAPLDPDATHFRLVLRDVTRERTLAARLQEAQKLEVVGRLASGVSHDFNNLLQVIVGAASLLQTNLRPDHPGQRELEAIVGAADLGSGLTRQLLALSRPLPDRAVDRADLNAIVTDCQPLLRRTLGPSNRLVMDLHDGELPVCVDPGQLTQVLINLAINGRDAMPTEGSLEVSTRVGTGDESGTFILAVSDTGVGIPEELVDHVFEPFFTTKTESGGTGLGLAVCKRITQSWGGTLSLRSQLGEGTTVRLTIPAEFEVDTLGPEDPAAGSPATSRRILVVDDEPMIRNLIARAIGQAGYEVLSADGMEMAVDLLKTAQRVDLMVTDVVMPGGSGVDLARRLWDDTPELPVVFVSGYTGNAVAPDVLAKPHVRFLGKPFRPAELLELVEEMCGGQFAHESPH